MHNFKVGDRVYIPKQFTNCQHVGIKGTVIRARYSNMCSFLLVTWDSDKQNTNVAPKYLRKIVSQMKFSFMEK